MTRLLSNSSSSNRSAHSRHANRSSRLSRLPNESTIRHVLQRYRRPLAIVLGVLALLAATAAARPTPEGTRAVLVATKSIEAGQTLSRDDLEVAPWPASVGAVESYYTTPTDAVGRMTAGPIAQGEPITSGRIVGPSLLASANLDEPNLVAAIVRLADRAYLSLARPGDHVDILAADSQTIGDFERDQKSAADEPTLPQATTLAKGARVLAIPGNDPASGLGAAVGLQSQNTESVVVLAVNPETATALAGASTRYRLSMVVTPSQATGSYK